MNFLIKHKLVTGKVTYVHRALFGALAGVGLERAPWQRSATMCTPQSERNTSNNACSRECTRNTPSGRHEKVAESWMKLARDRGVKPVADRAALEEAAARLGPCVAPLAAPQALTPRLG